MGGGERKYFISVEEAVGFEELMSQQGMFGSEIRMIRRENRSRKEKHKGKSQAGRRLRNLRGKGPTSAR